jgi:hypothetical protein
MSTTVCDYVLPNNVGDGEHSTSMLMPANQRKLVFDLSLPPGAQRGARAIVSFVLHTSDADDLRFRLGIGGHTKEYTVNSDVMRVVQEVLGPNVLNITEPDHNGITFEPLSGGGVLRISDVVLWFQRAIS